MRWLLLLCITVASGSCASDDTPEPKERTPGRASAVEPLDDIDLGGMRLRVGSKDFTEQLVLGHIATAALEEAGATVETEIGSAGTEAARQALLSGQTDLYWEYTGTAWIEFLRHRRPITDPQRQFRAVADEDLRRHGIVWLTPAPFNNGYALAVARDVAKRLDVHSISDIGRLLEKRPGAVSVCIESEFATRRDGLPVLERHYGFDIPDASIHRLDTGVIYGAAARSDPCNFGEVFMTDPRIATLDLEVLEDDKAFFAVYQPAISIREQVLRDNPEIADVFERVAPLLDEETIIELNRQVDVEGRLPRTVARDWLDEVGLSD